ncbi:MAG: hypothetical protein Q7R49_02890 [Candidatus Daviesbacteria bacterium]|nr:hypothetical protein [Candidatus Daviesbacteria bacterium]
MKSIAKVIQEVKFKDRPKNLSQEFQVYGVYLAESLQDTKHYSLYMRLAKNYDRGLLEEALNFTKAYYSAKNKARVFMWRLQQLKNAMREGGTQDPLK